MYAHAFVGSAAMPPGLPIDEVACVHSADAPAFTQLKPRAMFACFSGGMLAHEHHSCWERHTAFSDFLGGPRSANQQDQQGQLDPFDQPDHLAQRDLQQAQVIVVGEDPMASLGEDPLSLAGPKIDDNQQEEIVEQWTVEQPADGGPPIVHHGHQEHHFETSGQHHETKNIHGHHKGKHKASDESEDLTQVDVDENQQTPPILLRPMPRQGDTGHQPPPPPLILPRFLTREPLEAIKPEEQDQGMHPSVLIGGCLAIVTQFYLWGSVFVTFFKPQRPRSLATQPAGAGPGLPHAPAEPSNSAEGTAGRQQQQQGRSTLLAGMGYGGPVSSFARQQPQQYPGLPESGAAAVS